MGPTWIQADVFPVIARVIEAAYREHQRFITAQEIATLLLQDPEGRDIVETARTAARAAVLRMASQQHGILVQPTHHGRRVRLVAGI